MSVLPGYLTRRLKPKVMFDTNAICYFFGRDGFTANDLERARSAVLSMALEDTIRVIMTSPLGWELSKFHFEQGYGPERHSEMVRFIVTAASKWMLRNEYDRRRNELLRGRRLRDVEVFESCDVETTIARQQDEATVRRQYEMQMKLKEDERANEAQLRSTTVASLNNANDAWKDELDRELSIAWRQTVKAFAKSETRQAARESGLRLHGKEWPRVDALPTFWYSASFYASKARRVFIDSKKQLTSKNQRDTGHARRDPLPRCRLRRHPGVARRSVPRGRGWRSRPPKGPVVRRLRSGPPRCWLAA